MPLLRCILAAFDRLALRLAQQFLPAGETLPSSCADLFYGVFLSAAVIGIFQPVPDTAGFIPPPEERPTIEETVERFAPEVRFHPEERYFPSSVEWFLERSELRLEVDGGKDLAVLERGEAHAEVIPAAYAEGHRADSADPSRFFLQISNGDFEEDTREGNLGSAKTYVHFRRAADGSDAYDIQYWFFFPYSGPLMGGPAGGAHEGDWEHITVRIDEKLNRVHEVYYAAHDAEGRWMKPSELRFRDKTHPVVYTARYGHASYPRPGLKARAMLPADHTADGGAVWRTWNHVEIIADENGPRPEFAWVRYSGRWGEVGSLFSGPHGPAFQHYWLGD